MAVYIDVKSRFDDASGRKAAEEAKRYFDNAGTSSGNGFMGNFARAVESDTKVRAAADKVANSLDKITAAEAKRLTQLEKSKAVSEAVAAAETKLTAARESGDASAVTAAEEKLTALRSKQVEIDNKLVASASAVSTAERNRARAVREASQAYRDMGNDVDSLGDKLAKLGSAGGAVKLNLGLAALGTLPAAATAIAEVAGALQQLAGAGFAVPGIFAGIAASVGVGALGMYGMSDAITAVSKASDGTKSSVEAANKALADLAPAQADVVRTTVGLKGTFDDLRAIGSGNMFAGVSSGLKGLVGADLPAVTRGVDGISRGINQNLLQAMSSLGSKSSQGFLDKIFGNTADAQSRLTAAIDPMVHAVGTLTAAGSDTLPRLADAVGSVAERFDRFISAADGDGRLDKWINDGLTGFTNLGNTALNIGKSFTAVTEAAGGGTGLLGTLESATGRMSAFLNSTEGQSKLRDFFAEGRDMLGQLKDVASSAGPVLAGVFQSGINAANLWLPVIKTALDTLNKIPGGAEAVVAAFVAWRSITGVAALASSLTNIANLLKIVLPASAATGASAMSASLAGVASTLAGIATAAAALPAVAGGFALWGNNLFAQHPEVTSTSNEGAGARGRAGIADRIKNGAPDPNTTVTIPGYGGGGGSFGTPGSISADTLARKDDMRGVPDSVIKPVPVPGLTNFTDPVITSGGGGSGAAATPFVDPSKYQMGDPLAGMPAAVAGADPSKIYDADSKVITATHNLEQGRLALQVLEAKGNASQQELLTAKNNLVEQERALYDAQDADIKARTNQMKQSTSDLQSVFVPLDQGFGISGGIPGIVENLTKMFGNIAMAGAMAASPAFRADAQTLAANGGVAQGLFNSQYFTGSGSSSSPSYAAAGAGFAVPGGSYGLPGGTNTGGYGSGGKGVFPDWVQQVGAAFGVTPSTYSGHQESDRHEAGYAPNPNHENRGIDWTGSPQAMQNFADYLKTVPGMEQVIWNGAGQGTGDTVEIAGGRSQPGYFAGDLAGHGSHVHTRQSAPIPLPGGYSPASGTPMLTPSSGVAAPVSSGFSAGSSGTQSVYVVNMPTGGFLPGAPGAGGGLAAPGSVGDPGAAAMGPTPLGGGLGPDIGPPPITTGVTPGAAGGGGGGSWGIPGLPGGITGGGGQGPVFGAGTPGMAGRGAGTPLGAGTGAGAAGQGAGITGGTGVASLSSPGGSAGADGGGIAGAAASMFPGGGVAAALAARTVKFGAQALAIGAQGVMDTVLPAGSPLAANSWFSKLAGGISGAKPAKPNNAGGQGGNPQQAPAMAGAPAGAPGAGGGTTINNNVTTAATTNDGTARALEFHQQASNQGQGW